MKRDVYVAPDGNGGWKVQRDGGQRPSHITTTQTEAIELARPIAQHQGVELRIHRPTGEIRAKDSHGNDPFPPKG